MPQDNAEKCESGKRVWSLKKEGVPCERLVVEKHIEAEMIRCFELALYQKQFTEDSLSHSVYIS